MLEGLYIGDMYGASRRDALKNNVSKRSDLIEHHTHSCGRTVLAAVLSDGKCALDTKEFEYLQLDIEDSPYENIAKWFQTSIG